MTLRDRELPGDSSVLVAGADAGCLLVSCLCVTEDRPAFMPWLLWNYDKQDHPHRELVVVDSSRHEVDLPQRPDVRVMRCPPGSSVGYKRNVALREARGDVITWFDDDDWQHPRKLSLLVAALTDAKVAGSQRSWFVDLSSGRARSHVWRQGMLFNSLGVERELARSVAFDETRSRASDTPWVAQIRRRAGPGLKPLDQVLFFWLCHERNLSNPSGRRAASEPVQTVRDAVGATAWGETDVQLESLRERLHQLPAPNARRQRAVQGAPFTRAGRHRTRLCVVVTTYDRPDGLGRLLDDIEREWPGGALDVRVYDDASPKGYAGVEQRLRQRGWTYVRAGQNHGKRRWWQWCNTIISDLRSTDSDRYLILQDDIRLCSRFFDRSLSLWSTIADGDKASLFLHLDEQAVALGRAGWTPVREVPAGGAVRCGWVDLTAFLCERRLFEALDWHVDPIPARRWVDDPLLGSGVGPQLSRRLHRRGFTMYRVAESLTVHDKSRSVMNPEARRRWPMRTVRFVDGKAEADRLAEMRPSVLAAMASIPGRERGLEAVAEALLPQVDRLCVYLNGYPEPPSFVDHPDIRVATSQECGDRGDAGKFFWAGEADGYVAVCDDDLSYPADYIARLVAGLERYDRRAVVGFHGAVLHDRVVDYYRSRRLLHFSQALPSDTPVHVLGTGVAGYHTSAIAVRPDDFGAPNMADIHFALAGQRQRVPFVCLARERGWLSELPFLPGDSLFATVTRAGGGVRSEQTELVRGHGRWTLHSAMTRGPQPVAVGRRTEPAPPAPQVLEPGRMVPVQVRGPTSPARLMLPADDHITVAIQRSGTYYERDLLDAIRQQAHGGTFVDVGAHYGNHTVFFALECGAEQVVAVEPNAPSFEGLLSNVRTNGVVERVEALPIAIHPSWSRVEVIALRWQPRRRTGARTNSGMFAVAPAQGGKGVSAAPLDEALAPFQSITVLKVDVEGLGVEILESGIGVIRRDKPIIAVEAATSAEQARLEELLGPLGYLLAGRFCWTPTLLWASDRKPDHSCAQTARVDAHTLT